MSLRTKHHHSSFRPKKSKISNWPPFLILPQIRSLRQEHPFFFNSRRWVSDNASVANGPNPHHQEEGKSPKKWDDQLLKQKFDLSSDPEAVISAMLLKFPRSATPQPYVVNYLADNSFSGMIERDEQLTTFLQILNSRWSTRNSAAADLRMKNPHIATQCGPGGGKTFFLSEVSMFRPQVIRSHFPQDGDCELLQLLQNSSLAINIDFNGATTYHPDEKNIPIVAEAGLRVLHSYFVRRTYWKTFRKWAIDNLDLDSVSVYWALSAAVQHYKNSHDAQNLHVFIGVDEIARIRDKNLVSLLLINIGECMDRRLDGECSLVSSLITSLDVDYLKFSESYSGRPVRYLPLKSLANARVLFSKYEDKLSPDVLRALIFDCGGHPATLQALESLLSSTKWEIPTSYTILFHQLVEQKTRLSVGNTVEYVATALKGASVSLHELVQVESSEPKPLAEWIAAGYYTNTTVEGTALREIVPQITPIQLKKFADDRKGAFPQLSSAINFMFAAENIPFTGQPFAKWQLGWEAVLWNVDYYSKFPTRTLNDHYPEGVLTTLNCARDISKEIKFQPKPTRIHVVHEFADAYSLLSKMPTSDIGIEIFHFTFSNHPGFDGFILLMDDTGQFWTLNFEMKFSPNVDFADLNAKYNLWEEEYDKLYNQHPNPVNFPSKSNALFCMVAIKTMPKIPPSEKPYGWEKAPYTLMWLDISKFYPPTLQMRPQFLAQKKLNSKNKLK